MGNWEGGLALHRCEDVPELQALDGTARLVLVAMGTFVKNDREVPPGKALRCWSSAATIARRAGLHERTARAAMARLVQSGAVVVEHAEVGEVTTYYVAALARELAPTDEVEDRADDPGTSARGGGTSSRYPGRSVASGGGPDEVGRRTRGTPGGAPDDVGRRTRRGRAKDPGTSGGGPDNPTEYPPEGRSGAKGRRGGTESRPAAPRPSAAPLRSAATGAHARTDGTGADLDPLGGFTITVKGAKA